MSRTTVDVDSGALSRIMEVARETDTYDSRRAANEDGYQAVIELLCDRLQAEPKALRGDISAKYRGANHE